jgi:D-sedoheptulose 7-phosphate isomerase
MTMTGYLRELGRAMTAVEVTDGDGRAMSLDEGLERAVSILTTQTRTGLKVMFIGNGASAAIGSHQALDYWKNGGMRAVTFNDLALLTAISNDYSYSEVFEKPIEMFADAGDVLLAISSSGKSENILRGADAGRRTGCRVITLSGFRPDNPLRSRGELNFYVPSMSYGHVEVTHMALSHTLVDTIIERRNLGGGQRPPSEPPPAR